MRAFIALTAAAVLAGCGGFAPAVRPGAPAAPSGRIHAPVAGVQGPCVYLLRTTEASNFSHMHLVAPNCYIYINNTANMSYSTIEAAKILYASGPPNETKARFPEATPAPGPVVSDPCPTIRGCAYLMQHPPVARWCPSGVFTGGETIGRSGQVTCFNNLEVSGANVTVCGLIAITGAFLHLNNSSIRSCRSGVTFSLSRNTGDTNFSTAHLTLAPPTAGKYKGVLFYRPSSQGAAVDFSTCTCDFAGVLYFPTAPINYTSSGGKYQLLIFGNVNFSTDAKLKFGGPP